LLISGSTKLSFLWVLMGSLGGLEALGLLGLFVGPVVLALGAALLREWAGARDPGEAVQGVA
jgi:predicted PurR-regulated permease PerM